MTLEQKLKEIKLADRCRDFSWINERKQAGKLTIRGSNVTIPVLEKLRMFVRCTEEVYSGNWDLDIELQGEPEDPTVDIMGIVIYYDRLTITNSTSTNNSHNITDLFVKINIDRRDSEIRIRDLSGMRTSVTYAEYNSNYFHSHLSQGGQNTVESRRAADYWGSFCRGSGHINDFIAEINSDGISEERLMPFLVQITGLVSWESLEGGPHKRFGSIRVTSSRGRISNPSQADSRYLMNLALTHHRTNNIIPNIEFKFETGQYKIVDNERFVQFLTETTPLTDSDRARVICMADSHGTLYRWGSIPGYDAPPDTTRLRKYIFQGREIPFTIGAAPEVGDTSQIEYFLHPNVREHVKQQLEYDSNIKKVRESTIKRYSDQTNNATRVSRPSEVVM